MSSSVMKVKGLSPWALLAMMFLLALGSFVLVRQFQPWLYVTMDRPHFLVFHNIAELFSIMVSLSIFGIGWFSYRQSQDRHALFLGCAFLAIGLMDGMHTLGYEGMPDFITPNSANKSTQLWIIARLFTGMIFLASAWIFPGSRASWLARMPLLAGALAMALIAFVAVTWFPVFLPDTFREPDGLTPVKVYAEYLVIVLFALAFLAYWPRFQKTGDRLLLYYLVAFILCMFSELAFTDYMSILDTYTVLGHLYKVLAFFLIYLGIFVGSIIRPYKEAVDLREDLATREAHYRRLAENAPDMIYRMSLPSGVYEYVSPACRDIFGYAPEDFYRSPLLIRQAIHPNWQGYFATQWTNLLQGEMPLSYEYQIIHPASGVRWLNQRNVLVRDADGEPMAIEGIVTDITDRKKAEEKIRTAHEELGSINRIIMACASTLDAEAILNTAMDEALRITGLEGGTICYVTAGQTLEIVAHRATSQATIKDLATHAVKVGDCLCGECAMDHKPLILRDREAVLRFSTREATRGEDIRFHAAFPLITGQRCVGVLCVFTRTDMKPTEKSLRLLETVSAQIAMAIDNSRLYGESVQHAVTLEEKVRQRTAELEAKNAELERFNKLFVDRELKMVELKEMIRALQENQLGSVGIVPAPGRS